MAADVIYLSWNILVFNSLFFILFSKYKAYLTKCIKGYSSRISELTKEQKSKNDISQRISFVKHAIWIYRFLNITWGRNKL